MDNLSQKLEDFAHTFLDPDFVWRRGQREAILEIVEAYSKGTKTVILDAPVGSGKSLIGMAVAWLLNSDKKKGYILASELSLQEQYEKDFFRFHFNWGSIKGIDNYLCSDTGDKNSLGTCRIRNKNPHTMPCYGECPYFSARYIASKSPTSLLNYAYWLIMQNYVNKGDDDDLFPPRDFTICDEGHKILDIVQNHYSPRFDAKTIEKMQKLTDFFTNYKVYDHSSDLRALKTALSKLYKDENQDSLHETLLNVEELLEAYLESVKVLRKKVSDEFPRSEPPKEWLHALRLADWVKDLHCKVEDYNDIIDQTSTRNLVKNPSGSEELTFNCLQESYMMSKYFHQWTGFTLLMSATFSDPTSYLRSIALTGAKYIKMDSNFDFKNSPIMFYNRRRMTYNQMERNLPWLYSKIDEILETHKNENGIIHTASYDLAQKIYENIPKRHRRRLLVYNGTEEKRAELDKLKRQKNRVLMGPSLLEGLDLKDDWSRFAIFAKVPYLSLNDRFVAAKLKINPEWYRWKAIINVLQGTGRSVRSETDWAITYMLDGALADLIHNNRKSFPIEFISRLQIIDE
jgi:Rad3-related DNA helicase